MGLEPFPTRKLHPLLEVLYPIAVYSLGIDAQEANKLPVLEQLVIGEAYPGSYFLI